MAMHRFPLWMDGDAAKKDGAKSAILVAGKLWTSPHELVGKSHKSSASCGKASG